MPFVALLAFGVKRLTRVGPKGPLMTQFVLDISGYTWLIIAWLLTLASVWDKENLKPLAHAIGVVGGLAHLLFLIMQVTLSSYIEVSEANPQEEERETSEQALNFLICVCEEMVCARAGTPMGVVRRCCQSPHTHVSLPVSDPMWQLLFEIFHSIHLVALGGATHSPHPEQNPSRRRVVSVLVLCVVHLHGCDVGTAGEYTRAKCGLIRRYAVTRWHHRDAALPVWGAAPAHGVVESRHVVVVVVVVVCTCVRAHMQCGCDSGCVPASRWAPLPVVYSVSVLNALRCRSPQGQNQSHDTTTLCVRLQPPVLRSVSGSGQHDNSIVGANNG